jgi:protein-arginine deiminase
MRTQRRWFFLIPAALAAACGCGGGDTNPASSTGTTSSSSASASASSGGPAEPIIQIVVDANRDGKADPASMDDVAHKNDVFTDKFGASFLANIDDDDKDHVRDADDDKINGDADLLDLARIAVVPWPDAPAGAAGKLSIDTLSADAVRIWKKGLDGMWVEIAGSQGKCPTPMTPCAMQVTEATFSTDEIHAGLELGIEARRFRMTLDDKAWSGVVDLSYKILDKDAADGTPFKSTAVPDGTDHAKMRVAPWVLFGNLSPFDTVWASNFSAPFVAGIDAVTKKGGLTFNKIKNWDDQWTQDYFQTAWTAFPGAGGAVQGMRVANARPWGRNDNVDSSLPITWLNKYYLGQDRGTIEVYKKKWSGTSFDSHGNHDLLPPYTAKGTTWPLGRIITGSGILPETGIFYDAQQVQGPHFIIKTDWLYVGHVDEVFSYVPAATPRGWKLLVASPRLAKTMLEKASMDGNGGVHMFVGKQRYIGETNNLESADVTIDELLAKTDVMQWSQDAQTQIDADLDMTKAELELADDEIIEIPFFFEDITGYKVAFSPGTVNLLTFLGHTAHPDPFGPMINGEDLWKKDLQDRLGTAVNNLGADGKGLDVNFVNDWDDYHILDGEVHCGSNPEAPAPFASVKWWETGR